MSVTRITPNVLCTSLMDASCTINREPRRGPRYDIPMAGFSLRAALAGKKPRVHPRRRADAGAGHWRNYNYFQRHRFHPDPSADLQGCRPAHELGHTRREQTHTEWARGIFAAGIYGF